MAALTVQNITDAGAAPNFALNTVTASDTANVGTGHNTFYVIKNASGSAVTVTITPPGQTEYGTAWTPKTITVPATTGEKWIPLRKIYADDLGNATITTSAQASVTAALVRVV